MYFENHLLALCTDIGKTPSSSPHRIDSDRMAELKRRLRPRSNRDIGSPEHADDTQERIDAAKELASRGSSQAFSVLQTALRTETSAEMKVVIRDGIEKLGEKLVLEVMPLLYDEDWATRREAVRRLGKINCHAARNALRTRLTIERDYKIQCEIASSLKGVHGPHRESIS